jgi:RNA polymerase primary sigma factor
MRHITITRSITNRESKSLEKYLQEIGKVEMISPEEEARLASLIKKGDQKAIDRLVKANLRFVVSVAKKYQNQGLSLSDLINEGNLGLIEAAKRFDETRGFKFISYAVWWIRQNILIAIAGQSRLVRLPFNKVALDRQIQKGYLILEQKLEREPTPEELAELLNIETREITTTLTQRRHISLDTPLSEDEEGSLLDVLENPNAEKADNELVHTQSLKTELNRSLGILTDKQKQVICYFFGIGIDQPMSLDNISDKLQVSTERVRQIKEKAIERLRTAKQSFLLKNFLGA